MPLHTNGSERDLRPQVIKRKISGGTRSEAGRACRDAFLGLLLTCAKLGVSFWAYLGHRLGVPGADAPLPARPRQAALSARLTPGLLPLRLGRSYLDLLCRSRHWLLSRERPRGEGWATTEAALLNTLRRWGAAEPYRAGPSAFPTCEAGGDLDRTSPVESGLT